MRRSLVLPLLLVLLSFGLAEEGARYLIISADALIPSIQPLAEWRHAQGLKTKVVPLSQIGTDTTAIKNYVRNAWSNWPIRPEYLLLVGSPSLLPARYYSLQQGQSYTSDNIYADVGDNICAEIPYGRFPAKSAQQLDVMVAKTLAYSRNPELTDTLWMRRLVTIVREGGDSDDTIYWRDIRQAASLAASAGFVSCDSMSYYRGDNATKVATAIDAGRGIVLYRGAAVSNWYTPFQMNVAGLNNGWRLPIICSFTCATMTLAPGESMVGDAWVKAGTVTAPKGAVAFVGNTHSDVNVARVRSAMSRGFFTGLFSEGRHELGKAFLRGKLQLYTEYPSYTRDYRGFNLFGDPALDVWTSTPRRLQVEHPATIPPEPQQLSITVSSQGSPVSGALVCVSMDSVVYEYGNTDSSGSILFYIDPAHEGHLRLVVSGHNLYPYDTLIPVHEVGLAEESSRPRPGLQRLSASPALFRRSTTLNWTGPGAAAALVIRDALGRVVLSTAVAGNSFEWKGTDDRGCPVPAGVYVCTLKDSGGRLLASTRLLRLD